MSDGDSTLSSDAPLENTEDDLLGYSEYASYVAQVLSSQLPSDGYVVGISGRWGVGKSTMLNFIESCLEKRDDSPIVIRFHPWMFSGRSDLANKFLQTLGESLEKNDDESRFDGIKSTMESLSSSLSGLPISSITGVPAEQVASVVLQVIGDDEERLASEIKEEIADELRGSSQQIIIMIDDIDRLSPVEITQLFQLIKSVADFPNTTYVLSFDRRIVVESVEKEMGMSSGEEYLEKIIQLPIDIPNHADGSLMSLFLSQLNKFNIDSEFEYKQRRFDDIAQNGIKPFLDTPRSAIRLANTIAVTSGPMRQEIDFVDFVGLELLRHNYYRVYQKIRHSGDRFVGRRSYRQRRNREWDDYKDIFKLVPEEDRKAVESILKILFVKVEDNLSESDSHRDWDSLREDMRICHPRRYSTYFESAIPDGEISSVEMAEMMLVANDEDEFTRKLRPLFEESGLEGGTKAETFIRRLRNRTDQIDSDNVEPIIASLFRVGDRLITYSYRRAHNARIQWVAISLMEELLMNSEVDNRFKKIMDSAKNSGSVLFLSSLLGQYEVDHGEIENEKIPEEERFLNSDELEQLKSVFVENIEESADHGDLLQASSIKTFLRQWAEWTESNAPEEWVRSLIETDKGLIVFVDRMILDSSVSGGYQQLYTDPRWIDEYINLPTVRERIESIDESELTDKYQTSIVVFKQGLEYLDQGADPSSPEVWLSPLSDRAVESN